MLNLATVVATLLRFRARTCVVLAGITAMLCTATLASAQPGVQTQTRVWDFSSAASLNTWLDAAATPRTHLGNQSGSAELASDSPQAARGAAKGFGHFFQGGRVAKASELSADALRQGFTAQKATAGPLKFVDSNGVVRLTIKQGGARAPGSNFAHAEFRNAAGQRIDAFGNAVTRRSPGNHTPIEFDLLP